MENGYGLKSYSWKEMMIRYKKMIKNLLWIGCKSRLGMQPSKSYEGKWCGVTRCLRKNETF